VAEDFYSFDKVLKELHLEEEQLKKLVSEGEIRAFRDEDKMKFKAEDIERIKGSAASADDELPTIEAPTEELTDELFGDDEIADQEVGMATQQIADSSFLEESVDEIEPIELESAPEVVKTTSRRAPASTAGQARRRGDAEEVGSEGTGMQVVLVLAAVILIYGLIVVFNAAEVQSTAMTEGFANFMSENFMK